MLTKMRKCVISKAGEIETLIRKATRLADQVDDEDYSGVETLLEQAVAKDSNHPQALFHHAQLLWMMDQDLAQDEDGRLSVLAPNGFEAISRGKDPQKRNLHSGGSSCRLYPN